MSYFEGICPKCGEHFPLVSHIQQMDFAGTPLEEEVMGMSCSEFADWEDTMFKQGKLGWVRFNNDEVVGYGGTPPENERYRTDAEFLILDEMTRWEMNSRRCPECGEPNCDWF